MDDFDQPNGPSNLQKAADGDHPGASRRLLVLLVLTICVGLTGLWSLWPADAPPPRGATVSAVTSPRPAYVGQSRCAECHPDQAELFAESGHAKTFRLTAGSHDFDWMTEAEHRDEDFDTVFRYAVDVEGLWASLPDVLPGREFPLQYALGSGTHAVTFLSLIPNVFGETVGIEHRVSIFSDGTLRRTPGAPAASPEQDVEFFGKLHAGEKLEACVDCHTTTARIENTQVVDLLPHVQCERCHGPGSRHLAAVESGETELHLNFVPGQTSALEEIQMCGECHRLPFMFDDMTISRTDPKLTRFQPVGLLQSPCFTQSGGQLRCTTCHDPHEASSSRSPSAYEAVCRDCHTEHRVAGCPVSAGDCISCHMPAVEVHPGIAFHDHWIRIRDDEDPPAVEPSAAE